MKRLVVGAVVLLLATAVVAAVLVQQGQLDLNNILKFSDDTAPAKNRETVAASSTAVPSRANSDKGAKSDVGSVSKDVATAEASSALALSQPSTQPQSAKSQANPSFDIARIQPDGVSVFAGQGKPRQFVSVLADGELVGTAKVDENGEWVLITERKIASNDPELRLEVGEGPSDIPTPAAGNPGAMAAADTGTAPTPGPVPSDKAPSGRKAGPTARDVNEKMLSDLQRLVDDARQSTNREPAETDTKQAGAAPEDSSPVGDRGSAVAAASEEVTPAQEPLAADGASAHARDEPTKVAAMSEEQPTRAAPVAGDKKIPIPIQFVYREATFTPYGEKAVDLLLEYLKRRKLDTVTLSGHADERGSPSLNMDLSMDRLKTVENRLRSGGFTGELLLLPKGESEPFTGVDRSSFPKEDLFQLDRRVELRLAN